MPALVAQRPQPLFHYGRRNGGVFFQPIGDSGFKGIELALALPLRRPLCRRLQILLDGVPAHAQVPFDLADRPALGPVQAVQVVDLIGREHGANSVYPAEAAWIPGRCCLQDSETGGLRGGSASRIQTCARTELLFARFRRPAPRSQTSAAECFRSKAELLFARSRRRCFWSRTCCCWRLRSTAAGCCSRYRRQ